MNGILDEVAAVFDTAVKPVARVGDEISSTKAELKAGIDEVKSAAMTYATIQLTLMAIGTAAAVWSAYTASKMACKRNPRK